MLESFRVNVNPELLKWALESSGYTMEDVAHSVAVKPETVDSWLHGEAMPTWNQLKSLANKTKRPIAAFYLPQRPTEPPPPRDFRTSIQPSQRRFSPKLLQQIRAARALRSNALDLLYEAEELPSFEELPLFHVRDSTSSCAAVLRRFLSVSIEQQMKWPDSYAALNAWRDLLFERGVLVMQLPLAASETRGFSENYSELSLIVLSSKEDDPHPRIFTLFHELCHLCLRRAGVSDPDIYVEARGPNSFVERFCDRVAGEFLVPPAPAVQQLLESIVASGTVDMELLKRASNKLKVSQSAILFRMVEQRYIPPQTYSEIREEWRSRESRRKSGPVPLPRRRVASVGRSFTHLVLDALDQERLSAHEAGRCLGVAPKWLDAVRAEALDA